MADPQPVPINPDHDSGGFDCGVASLNAWVQKRALKSQAEGAARTYVCCREAHIEGYYSLASASIIRANAPGRISRNMPDPIPAMLIARLAVDRRAQGRGLGGVLLRDALLRILRASELVGVRAIMVHALDGDAAAFYARYGFEKSRSEPLTMFLPIATVKLSMENET